jgi:hypothetical protein
MQWTKRIDSGVYYIVAVAAAGPQLSYFFS